MTIDSNASRKSVGINLGNSKRAKDDYYTTPVEATEALIKFLNLTVSSYVDVLTQHPLIWEPACGNGAISRVLEKHGHTVISTDLRDDEDIYGEGGIDFLAAPGKVDWIITNPPYSLALQFVEHALSCAPRVAMLLRLLFLESQERYYRLFTVHPPKNVIVFSKRISCENGTEEEDPHHVIAFAWFVWDLNWTGPTMINWVLTGESEQ
jgi:hypothetical protein